MYRIVTCVIAFFIIISINTSAQTFAEDFESYNLDSTLGLQSEIWTTSSGIRLGKDGGIDDVFVDTNDAHSGKKSLFFYPRTRAQIVLPFNDIISTGTFQFKVWLKVSKSSSARFNFRESKEAKDRYTLRCMLDSTGQIKFEDTRSSAFLTATFPFDKWFCIDINANLNLNTWEVSVDGRSVGSFQNSTLELALLEFDPFYGHCKFWVDDISYTHTPYNFLGVNAAIRFIDIDAGYVSGTPRPSVAVRNLGDSVITSFKVTLNYDGNELVENINNVNIASNGTYDVIFSDKLTLVGGPKAASATISLVNGLANDQDSLDDFKSILISPSLPPVGRVVLIEEGTGTWCGYCPSATVFTDMMEDKLGDFFQGIAVHSRDPMAENYYRLAFLKDIPNYPHGKVDRGRWGKPSLMYTDIIDRLNIEPKIIMKNAADYDSINKVLKVSITAIIVKEIGASSFNIACAIIEDSVTGTSSGYSQANYYANNAKGEMGGYELLPKWVPASQMVYNHVARLIAPSFSGHEGAISGANNVNDSVTFNFLFKLKSDWDINNIHIVGIMINRDESIQNASSCGVERAIENGYKKGIEVINTVGLDNNFDNHEINLFPNPASQLSNLKVNFKKSSDVEVGLYKIDGSMLQRKHYGELIGAHSLPISTVNINPGIYLVKILVDGMPTVKKLIVR